MTDLPQLHDQLVAAAGRRRRPRALVPLTVALLAGLALALAVALRSGGDAREVPATPPRGGPSTARQAFAVLRRPARPGDAVGPSLDLGPRSVAVRRSRRVGRMGRERYFLVETAGRQLCLVARSRTGGGALGCGPVRTYLDGTRPQASFSDEPGPSTFAAIFPDHTTAVRLILDDGSLLTPRVQRNAVLLELPGRVAEMTWRSPDGVARRLRFAKAPPDRAADFYRALRRAGSPSDRRPGLTGARQVAPDVWIGQAGDSLCLAFAETTACHPRVGDVRRALVIVTPDRAELVAAIPDAIQHVTVEYADGHRERRANTTNVLRLGAAGVVGLRYHVDGIDHGDTDRIPRRSTVTILNGNPR